MSKLKNLSCYASLIGIQILFCLIFRNCRIHHEILHDLNAWDKRHLEQPDFDLRMNALKQIRQLIEKDDISVEFGAFVIYNCFYIFNNVC